MITFLLVSRLLGARTAESALWVLLESWKALYTALLWWHEAISVCIRAVLIPKITSKFDASFLKIPGMVASTWQDLWSGGKSVLTAQSGVSQVPTWDFLQLGLTTCGKTASSLGQICKSKSDLNWVSVKRLKTVCSELCECWWTEGHLSWTYLQNKVYCWNFSCFFPQVNRWTCLVDTETTSTIFSPVQIRKLVSQFDVFCDGSYI